MDLSLSRRDLGFADDRDPEESGISGKESKRRIENLVAACKQAVRERLVPVLREDFASVIESEEWSVELDARDPQTVIFTYPPSDLAGSLPAAIHPAIRLEMGARSDDWPAEYRAIRPYAAEAFPDVFSIAPSCHVHVLDARRTFWEKATLLHAEFHRPVDKASSEGLSRHYYDLYRLSQHDIGRNAVGDTALLARVVAHKRLFFPAAWAHYETAVIGGIHLVAPEVRTAFLRIDYGRMREMIFGEAPAWERIVQGLQDLEKQVNGRQKYMPDTR